MSEAKKKRCTEEQEKSINHLDGPLLMCAGAGSGKTFTLQNRIAHALEVGKVKEVDEILAITFTNKAAAEIKHRVRTELSNRGMHEAALLVDDARISTIHSACKRILREHALELGIDPELELIEDVDRAELLSRALGNVIARARRSGDSRFDGLLVEYGFSTVVEMIETTIDQVSMMPGGYNSVRVPDAPMPPVADVFRGLIDAMRNAREVMAAKGFKGGGYLEKDYLGMEESIGRLESIFAQGRIAEFDAPGALLELFASLHWPCKRKGAGLEERVEVAETVADLVMRGRFAYALPLAVDLLALSSETKEEYERLKERECLVDQDGLMSLTLQALESHPEIREHYQKAFKLVMVDEFQDTNQLQIDLIRHLCGEGLSTLCTVGDSQQSIYGFRNADVGVYLAHKEEMRGPDVGALSTELKENFRSHGDVLAFVRRVCGQSGYFVEDFLDLKASREEEKVSCPYRGQGPRVEVREIEYSGNDRIKGVRAIEARGIANWFASMRDAGHSPGDMVLLLGKTTDVEIYEQALRSQGLPCIITGGSKFWTRPEVRLVASILNVLANPGDTKSLFAVLSGDAFALSADDLLMLTTRVEQGGESGAFKRQSMERLLLSGLPEGSSERLRLVARALEGAWAALGSLPVSKIAWGLIEDSGWLTRLADLGVDGRVAAANIAKALRLVEAIEEKPGFDCSRVADRFTRLMVAGTKEKMGALIGEGEAAVRIMTVHSSKGLEFPIVAVGNCYEGEADSSRLEMKAVRGVIHLVLEPVDHDEWGVLGAKAKTAIEGIDVECPFADAVAEAQTAWDLKAAIRKYSIEECQFETRRLFYVAATRASEALLIAYHKKGKGVPGNVIGNIMRGLDLEDLKPGETMVSYGGAEPLRFFKIVTEKGIPEEYRSLPAPPRGKRTFSYPEAKMRRRIDTTPMRDRRSPLLSYSSMAEGSQAGGAAYRVGPRRLKFQEDEATVFGAAFHQIGRLSVLCGADEAYESVDRIASVFEISDVRRLYETTIRWLNSELYAEVLGCGNAVPEMSFCVPVRDDEGEALYLDGDMDLFCPQEGGGVLVVDYKTGGCEEESMELLWGRHLLQAQCYAYAALTQGHESVRLAFVRPENSDPVDAEQPQVVWYEFGREDVFDLRLAILAAGRVG